MASGANWSCVFRAIALTAIVAFLACQPVRAETKTDDEVEPLLGSAQETVLTKSPALPFKPLTVETWTGAEGFNAVRSMYGGATWAPDSDLSANGFRLRATFSMTRYPTTTEFACPNVMPIAACEFEFTVARRQAAVLAGWQQQFGATTLKVFAGLAHATDQLSSKSTRRYQTGPRTGLAASLEIWHNITPALWTSLDLALSRVDMERSGRLRLGWRLTNELSVGPEAAAAARNDAMLVGADDFVGEAKVGRLMKYGAFVRWDTGQNELSVAGGTAVQPQHAPSLYLSAQYLTRF